MSAPAYMPFFVADYLGDTHHLGTMEHGAYLLLIMTYWQRQKPLPDDDAILARYVRITDEIQWSDVRNTVSEFFQIEDGFWHHKRIDKEIAKYANKREKARSAIETRWGKRRKTLAKDTSEDKPDTDVLRTNYQPEPEPIEKGEPDGSPKKDEPDFDAIASEWNALASEFSLPQITKLSPERKAAVRARVKEHGEDCIRRAFIRIRAGPWLQGEGGWRASFDWVFGPKNFRKVLEGNYDQKDSSHGKQQATDAYGNLLRGFAAAAGAETPDADAEPDEAGACGQTISGVQFRVVN